MRPCAFADDDNQCPFGECFGEVNGNAGGAYPLLFFYQTNDCEKKLTSTICKEPAVKDWLQYRNAAAFANVVKN